MKDFFKGFKVFLFFYFLLMIISILKRINLNSYDTFNGIVFAFSIDYCVKYILNFYNLSKERRIVYEENIT